MILTLPRITVRIIGCKFADTLNEILSTNSDDSNAETAMHCSKMTDDVTSRSCMNKNRYGRLSQHNHYKTLESMNKDSLLS